MNKIAFLFPGQGAQFSKMGNDLFEHNNKFRKSIELFNSLLPEGNIINLLTTYDDEMLKTPLNAQLSIYAMSVAVGHILLDMGIEPAFLAGMSLGEYSALTVAGCLSISDGLRLVYNRGRLMTSINIRNSYMYAVIGLDCETIYQCLDNTSGHQMSIANINSKKQIVISGIAEEPKILVNELLKANALDVIRLNVAGPFHSPHLACIIPQFKECLATINWNRASFVNKVVSNVNSQPYCEVSHIPDNLCSHIYKPVLWKNTIEYLVTQGVTHAIEVGPGNTLMKLNRDICRKDMKVHTCGLWNELNQLEEGVNV